MKNTKCEKVVQVVLLIAKNFLKYHSKAGTPTNFNKAIRDASKIHTIRSNFNEWEKKILKVQNGNGRLILKQWMGLPYRTPQVKLFDMKEDVGIQMLEFIDGKFIIDGKTEVEIESLAKNDFLSLEDFNEWFKVFPTEPMAIIHFTKFRY